MQHKLFFNNNIYICTETKQIAYRKHHNVIKQAYYRYKI